MRVYAVGGNRWLRMRRRTVDWVLVSAYAVSGTLAGIAGVILAARVTAGIPATGTGYELDSIAAVWSGVQTPFGQRRDHRRDSAWAVLIRTLNNGFDMLNISSFVQKMIRVLSSARSTSRVGDETDGHRPRAGAASWWFRCLQGHEPQAGALEEPGAVTEVAPPVAEPPHVARVDQPSSQRAVAADLVDERERVVPAADRAVQRRDARWLDGFSYSAEAAFQVDDAVGVTLALDSGPDTRCHLGGGGLDLLHRRHFRAGAILAGPGPRRRPCPARSCHGCPRR